MDVIQLRRQFHQYPEVGFTEFYTAYKIVNKLQNLGYKLMYGQEVIYHKDMMGVPDKEKIKESYNNALKNGADNNIIKYMKGGFTAVIGIIHGNRPGPTVAFRFDMDGLPVQENNSNKHFPKNKGFRSKNQDNMHACGHDAHIAIGLCLAERMANGNFAGTLKLIFQPAEEGGRGAYAMMKKGVVDDVDQIYCSHIGLSCPTGKVSGSSSGWLASKRYKISYQGVSSHSGTSPEKGRNALLGAVNALLHIHAIPRYGEGGTRVNVGTLEGGTAPNVVPSFAKMSVEIRATSQDLIEDLNKRVKKILNASASMYDLNMDIERIGQSTNIECDDELSSVVLEEAKKIKGFDTYAKSFHVSAGEDASWFIDRVQKLGGKGTYIILGSNSPAPHHHSKFDIEEKILPASVDLLAQVAQRSLKEN